jgi:hypothetical protein
MTLSPKIVAPLICIAALAACGPKAAPYPTPDVATARPTFPAWAEPMIGKPFNELHLTQVKCLGATDVVTLHYTGVPAGYQVEGWGWDGAAGKPVQRVVLVSGGVIVGAGEGGRSRPDVATAAKKVTSPMVGWRAEVNTFSGKLEAFALLDSVACPLGQIER